MANTGLVGRGEIALRQLRYVDAAEYFKQAAVLVPDGHSAQSADYLQGQAEALCREGCERGDNSALNRSIEVWRTVLRYRPRDRVPLDWAMTQNSLAIERRSTGPRRNMASGTCWCGSASGRPARRT